MFYRVARAIVRVFLMLFFRPCIADVENIDHFEDGAILICNHRRMSDVIFLAIATKRILHFMGKSELFRNRFINALFRSLGAFPVGKNSADTKAIRQAMAYVKDGEIVVIFPEGTRSKSGTLLPFENGVAFLALQCKSEVIPAHIDYPKGLRNVRLRFAKSINIVEMTADIPKNQRMRHATEKMRESILALEKEQK